MCLSIAEGGKRCDIKKRIYRTQTTLNNTQDKLTTIKEAIKHLATTGENHVNIDGKNRRVRSLKSEGAKLSEKIGTLTVETQELQRHYELTNQGIAELRARAEDTSLTIEQRKHYGAIANNRENERVRTLDALDKKRRGELNLHSIMEADGFDDATIKECNIEISVNKYPRTSKEYKRRISKAVNEMQAIESSRLSALKACKPDQRPSVEAKYAEQLAEVNTERLEAQYGYDSTVEGLRELKNQAEDRTVKMTQSQRHMLVTKYEKAKSRHDGDKRDRNNRDSRRNNIKRAYKEKGLDPSRALKAHTLKVVADSGSKVTMHPSVMKNIRRTVLLTDDETTRVEANFRASGYKNMSSYIGAKVLDTPTKNFQAKPLTQLNMEAERFSDGEAHRQWTTKAGRRSVPSDTKVNNQADEKITSRAKSFHMTRSSYMRAMLLGIDPRQVQNDRSDVTNEVKTSMMMDMARKAS